MGVQGFPACNLCDAKRLRLRHSIGFEKLSNIVHAMQHVACFGPGMWEMSSYRVALGFWPCRREQFALGSALERNIPRRIYHACVTEWPRN